MSLSMNSSIIKWEASNSFVNLKKMKTKTTKSLVNQKQSS